MFAALQDIAMILVLLDAFAFYAHGAIIIYNFVLFHALFLYVSIVTFKW